MVRGPQVRAFFYQVQRAIGHGHSGKLSEVFRIQVSIGRMTKVPCALCGSLTYHKQGVGSAGRVAESQIVCTKPAPAR